MMTIFILVLVVTIVLLYNFNNKNDSHLQNSIEHLIYCKGDNLDYYLSYIKLKIKLIKDKAFYSQMVKRRDFKIITSQEISNVETKWNQILPHEFKVFIQEIGFILPYNIELDDHYSSCELDVSSQDSDDPVIISNKHYNEVLQDKYVIVAFANCNVCCGNIIMSLSNKHYGQIYELREDILIYLDSNYINWHIRHLNNFTSIKLLFE